MAIELPKCPPAPYRDKLWHRAHTAKEQEEYEREVKEWNIQYAKWLKLMESLLRSPTKTDKQTEV